MKFPRSTYYKALICVPSDRQKQYETFSGQVKAAFNESKQRYGAVEICRFLNGSGTKCSLKRDFAAEGISQKWCTDITYIHVQKEGWTYLASVMDLCSRKIIGYPYGTAMTADLAVAAVKNACLNVKETKGIVLHSDLGSQYTSQAFESYLANKEMRHSFESVKKSL